jgi:hypothetical protein
LWQLSSAGITTERILARPEMALIKIGNKERKRIPDKKDLI